MEKRGDCVLGSCAELASQVPLEKCSQENGVKKGGDGGVEDQEEPGTHRCRFLRCLHSPRPSPGCSLFRSHMPAPCLARAVSPAPCPPPWLYVRLRGRPSTWGHQAQVPWCGDTDVWGAVCPSHVSMELAALQVLLGDAQVGGKHLGASQSFGDSMQFPSCIPESQGRQGARELFSALSPRLILRGQSCHHLPVSCTAATPPSQPRIGTWTMSSAHHGCDTFLKREKGRECELGAISQLLEQVSVTLMVSVTGPQAGGLAVPSCCRCWCR